jgi:hypothetical protein
LIPSRGATKRATAVPTAKMHLLTGTFGKKRLQKIVTEEKKFKAVRIINLAKNGKNL